MRISTRPSGRWMKVCEVVNKFMDCGGLERGFARYIIRNPFSTEKMEFKPPNAANKDGASFSYGHDFGPQNSDPTAIRSTGTHP